ncbi:hypothetical protein [Saccharothrix syringae]|uniref:MucR family transcriptional regulator n=1 Tax=Saccharothrix syringae TaxID=103733 RepID=A0A5Q0GS99_SACSY|nr:hypothetical protein [Saccharothrix syringae]QFZ16364.1 hypothetical protein EKG83_01815 [Saccharothrix syringae]
MIEPTGPLPPWVYWRRRALAVGAAAVALLGLVWLSAALLGDGEPVAPRAVTSTPPAPAGTPAATSSPTSSPASPAQPTPPPGPPAPCEDAQLGVAAVIDKPAAAVGEEVGMGIAVSNTGPFPCTKDIGRHVRELVVTTADGGTRLWSSNDCHATEGSEVRVLRPGERFHYGLRWPGTTSEPGCAARRALGPGDYLVVARVAGRESDPVVFRLG